MLDTFRLEGDSRTIIDTLIEEQQSLAAVERFARLHDAHALGGQSRRYRELMPAAAPGPGAQYAFDVDLDRCSGCKACVTACHSLNGLDDNESWRATGLLVGEHDNEFIQATVTTACHHCVDPACSNGCPVLAYEKDPATGIVRHLDDQCIGCQYCVMMCPYEVPRYSTRLGIVRKCDLCTQRLGVGEAPACAQACPNEAIHISIIETQELTAKYRPKSSPVEARSSGGALLTRPNLFLPDSPDPAITVPTTRYRSERAGISTLRAADAADLSPSAPHHPLVFMLVVSQAVVGFVCAVVISVFAGRPLSSESAGVGLAVACVAMLAALGVATLHLGQPFRAWKIFLGLRRSWFSREVLAFGLFTPALAIAAGSFALEAPWVLSRNLGAASAILGVVAVICSMMIYVATRRPFWSTARVGLRFLGTTVLLGAAGFALVNPSDPIFWLVLVTFLVKTMVELEVLRHAGSNTSIPLRKTALLQLGPLRRVWEARWVCGFIGGILLPLLLLAEPPVSMMPAAILMWAVLALGELAERALFFTSASFPGMPGGVAS